MENNKAITLDDRPFNAMLDGIIEKSLFECYQKEPEKFAKQVANWEKKNGRKIGQPTQEEVDLRESAWA